MNNVTRFSAVQVENGWVVTVNGDIGCMGTQYVFRTLAEFGDWLIFKANRSEIKDQ